MLISGAVLPNFQQHLKGITDPERDPLSSTPIYTFLLHTHQLSAPRGQMLVTKSLKAELPKAVALDGALVDEGASRRL